MNDEKKNIRLAVHREADELGKFAAHFSIRSDKSLNKDEVIQFLDELLYQITKECMEHGADMVGHVKGVLRSEGGVISASLLDLEKRSNITHDLSKWMTFKEGDITLNIIVHGIWDNDVKKCSLAAIHRVFNQFDLEYVILNDCCGSEKTPISSE